MTATSTDEAEATTESVDYAQEVLDRLDHATADELRAALRAAMRHVQVTSAAPAGYADRYAPGAANVAAALAGWLDHVRVTG